MRQHRVGDIGVYILMHKVEPGVQGTVGVPQRQGCIVREAFSLFDVLVQPSETAVGILEKERVQGGVIGGRVECFFCLLVGCDPVFLQFLLPKVYSFVFQTVECHTVQFLHVQLCSGGADCGNGSLDSHFFAFFRCKGKASHQVLSPGFVCTPEAGSVVDDRFLILHDAEVFQFFREDGGEIDMAFRPPAFYQFVAGQGRVVLYAKVRPFTVLP